MNYQYRRELLESATGALHADEQGLVSALPTELGHAFVLITCHDRIDQPAAALAEALGCLVVNIHQAKLGASSMRDFGPRQRAFKATVDPFGICNPGHLADEVVPEGAVQSESARLVASGWSSRWSAPEAPTGPSA